MKREIFFTNFINILKALAMKIINVPTLLLITASLAVFLTSSCEKEKNLPIVTTITVTEITHNSAISGGEIIDDKGLTITERGVCWSTNPTPTIKDHKTSDGSGAGDFVSNITGLDGGTKYFIRAYSTNSSGTGYGMALSFTTLGSKPSATTLPATNVLPTAAILNGKVNPNYLTTTVSFEYGPTTNYGNSINASLNPISGTNEVNLSATLSGLIAGITYHYRVKAVNSLGEALGSDMTFEAKYTIGSIFGGGIICYVDPSGQHGIIAAQNDQHNNITWYNGTYVSTNTFETTIYSGKANTATIVSVQGQGSYAAKICDDLVIGTFDDWYLPSREELDMVYRNLKVTGLSSFISDRYWSSTEYGQYNAWWQQFWDGGQGYNHYAKNQLFSVRAVRAF